METPPPPIKGVEWDPTPTPNKPDMGLFGGGPTQHPESIYRWEVPHIAANFDKTRQRTQLDDLPGGDPLPYEKIQKTKGKHLEKALPQEQNSGVEWQCFFFPVKIKSARETYFWHFFDFFHE